MKYILYIICLITIFVILVIMAIKGLEYSASRYEQKREEYGTVIEKNKYVEIDTLSYCGHSYIMFSKGVQSNYDSSVMSVVHNPDCEKCKTEK